MKLKYLIIATFIILTIIAVKGNISGGLIYAREQFYPCTDSDGQNYFAKGNITNTVDFTASDYCDSAATVAEYYCTDNNEVARKLYDCPTHYNCTEGACVKDPSMCIDSDDSRYFKAKGTVTTSTGYFEDYCANDSFVIEFFCTTGNEVQIIDGFCINGCLYGACLPGPGVVPQCADSDLGRNLKFKGAATVGGNLNFEGISYTDYCEDNYIVENWCVRGVYYSSKLECPEGDICMDGACV